MKILGLFVVWEMLFMIVFGFGFCIMAMIGYKGMDFLLWVVVLVMLIFIFISVNIGLVEGGIGLMGKNISSDMSFIVAIIVIIGIFVSGGM